jgi:hypothetical protein
MRISVNISRDVSMRLLLPAVLALAAVCLGLNFGRGTDPDSAGYASMGLFLLGVPAVMLGNFVAFCCGRTTVGGIASGITFFIAAFLLAMAFNPFH